MQTPGQFHVGVIVQVAVAAAAEKATVAAVTYGPDAESVFLPVGQCAIKSIRRLPSIARPAIAEIAHHLRISVQHTQVVEVPGAHRLQDQTLGGEDCHGFARDFFRLRGPHPP
jgi:hypothetical protein